MKKIGILTLFDPINYGACLQTYALRAFLEQCGFDAQVIDYRHQSGNVDKRTSFQKMRSYIWKNTLYKLLCDKKRIERTEQFKKDNIQYSADTFYNIEEMDRSCNYDALIVGSDQVWSPRINGRDAIYFGHGMSPSTKLVTYAASLGGASIEEMRLCDSNLKTDLARFSHVSVREASSIPVLAQLGIQASWSPDPTFLLTGDQWVQKYASIADKPKHRYVLMYTLNGEKELVDAAQTYARTHGIEAVALHYNTRGFNGFTNIRDASPSDFLQLMHGAQCIFTDSFHGTCFALNFGKEFYVKLSKAKPLGNARMVDLLERYGVTGRYLDTGETPAPSLDHATIQEALKRDRRQGLCYLENCVLRG